MKRILLFTSILISTCSLTKAQIQLNTNSIIFNTINETQLDSAKIVVHNFSNSNINIKKLQFYKTYKSNPFFVKNFNTITIDGNDSISFYVYFQPKHNIFHNSELMLVTEPSMYSKTIDLKGQGKYSITYYANTENQVEENLKSVLKTQLAAGYVSLGYNVARDNMFMTIDNQKVNGQGASVNSLECVYTGKKSIGYTSRSESQTNDNFNTEHTFPQGFFSQNEPMRSDLHHLFPTNDAANNSRSNLPFGIASTPYVNDAINNPSHLGSNNLYEPRDVQKGRTARAMMYFVLRYQDYSNFFAPQESILRTWHENFPPNTIDKKRNADIFVVQKNRNPFVDYPEFADRITKLIGTSSSPVINSLRWIDTVKTNTIIDTISFVEIEIPFVNDGNTEIKMYQFSSLDTNIAINADTVKIAMGESAYLKLKLNVNSLAASKTSIVNFNSNLFNGLSFVFNYSIDSLKSGINTNRKNKFNVYPNPASNILFLDLDENKSYQIFNQLGAKVQEGELSIGKNSININTLKNGMYILMLGNTYSYFIKENEH
jgi:Endonuclease I/Secretion system C-terminal sorting domain